MIEIEEKKILVGIDIGTTKISILVGQESKNKIKIIGIGECKSKGIEKGYINNLKSVTDCLKKAIFKAETASNYKINSVYVTISNKYICSKNEIGIVPIFKKEVSKTDVYNVIYTASSIKIKNDHKILHIIPQEYSIDQQIGINNPIGLRGKRMEAKVHIITCHENILKNVQKSIEKTGILIDKFIYSGIASGEAVLTKEEKYLGVGLLDIGGGTIDIAIYICGYIYYSKVIPYAGKMVTNDIAYAFCLSITEAEHIKKKYGYASLSDLPKKNNIKILDTKGNILSHITLEKLVEVIEARYIELLNLANQEIKIIEQQLRKEKNSNELKAGIVLTGNASQIKSLTTCAYNVFRKSIRIGVPIKITSDEYITNIPKYSTAVGLLYYGKNKENKNTKEKKPIQFFNNIFKKFYNWFNTEF